MEIQSLLLRLFWSSLFYFFPDLFIPSAIRAAFKKHERKAIRTYWFINLTIYIIAGTGFLLMKYMAPEAARFNLFFFGIFISLLFSKLFVGILLIVFEDIYRIPYSLFTRRKRKKKNTDARVFVGRRRFIAQSILLIGAIPFSGFLFGIFKGRYNFTVHRQPIYFDDLPPAFDGVTITQLSDLHIGSWDKFSKEKLEYMVELVRSLNSDILFFTGDIVNSRWDEMDGWYDTFNKFSAPLGIYSILGNHDYGDYVKWKTDADKEDNLNKVKNIHPQLGFKLLLNENLVIEKGGEKIHLIGVENWGSGHFPKFGDLTKASAGVPDDAFKILLSHDPSHWEAKVLEEKYPPQLTLSGHTHGFQMGIETPAFKFSPSQFLYPQWAGLYQKEKHFIYVNRGLGTVGYPGRIGIWPEITQIILKRKE
ncbi:MAG: metallophosphoesterase [Chitinophagales bacterium]